MYRARPTWNRRLLEEVFRLRLPFTLYDTETTGINTVKDRVVQFAGIRFRFDENGRLVEDARYISYVNAGIPISAKASAVNGITDAMLLDAPQEAEALGQIRALFGETPVLCGYNIIGFDNAMMRQMYTRNGAVFRAKWMLDVSEMARDLVPPERGRGRTLREVAERYGVDKGINFHDAAADIEATRRLLLCFREEYAQTPLPRQPLQPLYANRLWFSAGHNRSQIGVYVATQFAKEKKWLWYSTVDKCWYSAQLDLAEFDIDRLTLDVLKKTGLPMSEFGKLTEKKFAQLKAMKEAEGVYL